MEMKECTFQPDLKLTKERNSSVSSMTNPHSKLHADAGRHQDRLRKKEILRNTENLEDCTFSPRINFSGTKPRNPGDVEHFEKLHKTHETMMRDRRR